MEGMSGFVQQPTLRFGASTDAAFNSNSDLFDLIDLEDLFSDDFFPDDLNFAKLLQDTEELSRSGAFSGGSTGGKNVSAGGSSSSSSSSRAGGGGGGSEGPIMVPPRMPLAIPVSKGQGKTLGGPNGKPASVEDLVFPDQNAAGSSSDFADDVKGLAKATASSSSAAKRKGKHTDVDDITEEERTERRERNREHAKRSRIRKRVILDLLQDQLGALRGENVKLRRMVMERMPEKAGRIFEECTTEESRLLSEHGLSGGLEDGDGDGPGGQTITTLRLKPHPDELIASNSKFGGNSGTCSGFRGISGGKDGLTMPRQRAKILMEPDFRLMESLIHSQQNFVLSDPSLPDNPIVYCSEGFCKLTGYKRSDVLGRNCRFLQGPGTDQGAVDIIRQGVSEGRDISVCLLNYKADGSPFWNQFFVGALRDMNGNVVNFVGIQCEVNTLPIEDIKERVKRLPMPDSL